MISNFIKLFIILSLSFPMRAVSEDREMLISERLIALSHLDEMARYKAATPDGQKKIIDFIVSQYFVYWIVVDKLESPKSCYVEASMGEQIDSIWESAYFQEKIKNPSRVGFEQKKKFIPLKFRRGSKVGSRYSINTLEEYHKAMGGFKLFLQKLRTEYSNQYPDSVK